MLPLQPDSSSSKNRRVGHMARASRWRDLALAAGSTVVLVGLGGCGTPNFANIALRKQVSALEAEVAQLKAARAADSAATRPWNGASGPALQDLVTTASLKFSRLTEFATTPDGKHLLRLYVVPADARGDTFKAAGTFDVTAKSGNAPVATWQVSRDEALRQFVSMGVVYSFVLELPIDSLPTADVELNVTFTEELTGRIFEASHTVKAAAR